MAIQMTSNDLNVILRENPVVTLSNTLPAAPGGSANITWQFDVFGNISAYAAAASSSVTVAGSPNVGVTNDGSGNYTVSWPNSNTDVNFSNNMNHTGNYQNTAICFLGNVQVFSGLQANTLLLTTQPTATSATAGAATGLPVAPLGYMTMSLNGTNVKIPYYSV